MSYSEKYHANIQYSGSISYSYPASQSGGSGTAHYNGNIPVNVVIHVNTQPFDGSVGHFNSSVDALTGSVAAMHAAQCVAIQKTSEEVSSSLINGFFGLINTELSQQIQALDSAIKAAFGLITEQGKAVTDKKNQMEGDFNRISSRYIRLFTDLDTECHKRIYALDKPSFLLSEKVQKQLLSETSCNTVALNLLGIEEVSSSKTLMFASSINRKTLDVLKTLHDYIMQESTISVLVNSLLLDEEIEKNITLHIPVIWIDSDMLEGNTNNHESFIPGFIEAQAENEIAEKAEAFCSSASRTIWSPFEEQEKKAIDSEFKVLAEACFVDSNDETERRIYQTMLSLWQNSELFSLKRSV